MGSGVPYKTLLKAGLTTALLPKTAIGGRVDAVLIPF